MVTVDDVQSEIIVERGEGGPRGGEPPVEVRVEELRETVRVLVREEIERFLRTETTG